MASTLKYAKAIRDEGEEVFIRLLIYNVRIKLGDDEDAMFWLQDYSIQEKDAAMLSVDLGMIKSFSESGYCDDCILWRLSRSPLALDRLFNGIYDDIEDFYRQIEELQIAGASFCDVAAIMKERRNC
ncbi:MAG TPA: hypothetical protein P5080_06105 [Candidatus Paceibacterota bacterium]|nr:hypothetical protein [Candidatus Pacearchaeota archaeon]HRZ51523.1 hypothetical protein [Candidatus Paceibacterota bacterium]HSA37240.1 hypothetical protein [Candidatus Paceibacterota bacterium]